MSRTIIWSYGGGVQSVAIAALIIQKQLPMPDMAIIVDTGYEKSTTWEYMDNVVSPALKSIGLVVQRVPKGRYATVDYLSKNGRYVLIPAFTTQSGRGKLPCWCSGEWKRNVVRRWARAQGIKQVIHWVGMSTDESKRGKGSRLQWWENQYPLIDVVPTSRAECFALIESVGWPAPSRSSCWMCPNQSDVEWKTQQLNHPEDHKKAIEFERLIRKHDKHVYLHKSPRLLSEIDFTKEKP